MTTGGVGGTGYTGGWDTGGVNRGILVVIPKIVYQCSYKLFLERVRELLYESLGEIFLKKDLDCS